MIDEYTFEGMLTAEDGSQFPLSGINKGAYNPEGGSSTYSHANAAYIYTDAWTALERPKGSSTTPTEVLVENDIITQISLDSALPVKVPKGGYILRTHGLAAQFVKAHLVEGQKLSSTYKLRSKTTQQELDPSTLQMMIGGIRFWSITARRRRSPVLQAALAGTGRVQRWAIPRMAGTYMSLQPRRIAIVRVCR